MKKRKPTEGKTLFDRSNRAWLRMRSQLAREQVQPRKDASRKDDERWSLGGGAALMKLNGRALWMNETYTTITTR